MASSFSDDEPVRAIQFYKDLAQRDLELIEDMRKEISGLKSRVNLCVQSLSSKNLQIRRLRENIDDLEGV